MSFLEELNPVQREAVQAVDGPVMVVAGAGSGKTRVLTYRIAHLVQVGVPPYRILALTFTNKAAGEMKGRVMRLVGERGAKVWMGTFHSIFARILRTECEHLGYRRNFSIYDTDDSLHLIKSIQTDLGIPMQRFNPHAIRARISSVKNRCLSPGEYARQASDLFEEQTARVYAEYQNRLKRCNAMDFDDLLLKPIELFEKNKRILKEYQDRFSHILVDEYQDTNRAQYLVLKLLAGRHRNICVVGDDAQSIYSFRGADIRNILDFQSEFSDCKIFRLEQNYRSTKSILAAADHLIKNNRHQIQKNLWTENQQGETVRLLICDDDKDEGEQTVKHIQYEITKKKLDLNDFAILYRTNAQSRTLEDALRRNGIPYVIVGGVEFYRRKEIKDVLAYLRLICNLRDDEGFLRIVNYPARGIGETTIRRLDTFARKHKCTYWEALERLSEIDTLGQTAVKHLSRFRELIRKYAALKAEMSASEVARALVDELGILREFKEEGTPEAMSRWENVQELLSAITEYTDDHPGASLDDFLQEVSLVSDVDKWDSSRNAVTLMTVHSAKGLEFPVVFVAGLEEGLFPFYNSVGDQKELEEERRLCYVGMTRAADMLYLSYARSRYRFGVLTYPSPSRFIDEIGSELMHVEAKREGKRRFIAEGMLSPRRITSSPTESRRRAPRRATERREGENVYFSQDHPNYEHESQLSTDLHVGSKVEHEIFGRGKVVGIEGRGESAKAVVDFQKVGRKLLLLKYAPLRIV